MPLIGTINLQIPLFDLPEQPAAAQPRTLDASVREVLAFWINHPDTFHPATVACMVSDLASALLDEAEARAAAVEGK